MELESETEHRYPEVGRDVLTTWLHAYPPNSLKPPCTADELYLPTTKKMGKFWPPGPVDVTFLGNKGLADDQVNARS